MTKLFVGGLSYTTGAETLGKLFEKIGQVKGATIATNNGNSLGHGTVEMETREAAEQAIQKLNGTELDGRTIRVNYENDRSGGFAGRGRGFGGRDRGRFADRGARGFGGRGRGFGERGRGRRGGGFPSRGGFNSRGGFPLRGGFPPRGGFPSRGGYGARGGFGGGRYIGGGFGGNIGYGGGFPFQGYVAPSGFGGGFGGRRGGGGFRGFNRGFGAPFRRAGGGGFRGRGRGRGFGGGRGGRGGGRRAPFDPNTPLSKTRVYINNLPFVLTEEELQKIFTEKGINVKEVSLGKRRFNTNLNVGYGFVEFETEEDQAKVLREMNTIDINNRPCTVFAARPIVPKENQESTGGGNA